jgi:hypothetical protein
MNYTQLVSEIESYTENTFSSADVNTFIEQAEQRIYNTIQFPSLRKNVTGTVGSSNKYLSCPDDFLATYSLAVYPAGGGDYIFLLNKDVNFIREAYPSATSTGTPKYYALFGPTTSGSPTALTTELSFIVGPTPDTNYGAELHYFFYPPSIVQGIVATVTISAILNAYVNGTYYNVPILGVTNGTGALATVVVSGTTISTVTISNGGSGYTVSGVCTVSMTSINAGADFGVVVATVLNSTGTTWLGDNYDSVLLYGALVEAYTFMKGEPDMVALVDKKYNEALAQAKRLGDGLERQDAYRSGQYRQRVT